MLLKNIQAIISPKLLWISFGFIFIAAYFSKGYHHPDEHFQLLEFSHYKLGLSTSDYLPWEFHSRIRPALQPYLVVYFTKCMNLIGVNSPFTIIWMLRLLSGCYTWIVCIFFLDYLLPKLKFIDTQRFFVYWCLFLWFIPYIGVRFSSENLSGTSFLWGFYCLLKYLDNPQKTQLKLLISAGLLFGISFCFRFQIAFALIGLGIGLLMQKKFDVRIILPLLVSGSIAIAMGSLLDYYFYGEWVFTPYEYFKANILAHKAASFGVSPWYYYITAITEKAIHPISIPLIVLWFMGMFQKPKSLFFYTILVFVVAHSLIGHKEVRFLFPLLFCYLYMAAIGLDKCWEYGLFQRYAKWGFYLLCVVNIPVLIGSIFMPAEARIPYYEKIDSYTEATGINRIISINQEPYRLEGLDVHYYRKKGIISDNCYDENQVSEFLVQENIERVLLFYPKKEWKGEIKGYSAKKIYCLVPDLLKSVNPNHWQDRAGLSSLYELRRE